MQDDAITIVIRSDAYLIIHKLDASIFAVKWLNFFTKKLKYGTLKSVIDSIEGNIDEMYL